MAALDRTTLCSTSQHVLPEINHFDNLDTVVKSSRYHHQMEIGESAAH